MIQITKKIAATLLLLFFSFTVSATPLNKIVVFGDSLSDNGNFYAYMQHKLPLSPPYFEGRFSNGPIWAELLAQRVYPDNWRAHLLDYAFGGAGVLGENGDFDDEKLFTLNREIDSYLLAHQNKADEHSLFVLWIGANNYLAVPDDIDEAVRDVNWGIKTSLQRLVKSGAKHILVVNLPDLGKTPAAREFELTDELSYCTLSHNAILEKNVAQLQAENPNIQFMLFDANQSLYNMLQDPEKYGFSNTTETCYQALMNKPSSKAILNMVATVHPQIGMDKNGCEGYFFFDAVHPSALAHKMMSEQVLELLQRSGVAFG
ncbi:MAG: SGNH/GDSL hydrolase family protein [Legionellaceae bacterium]|nr:SGNH/GDSL hydrolase family protein [Legionellaceae bacterium]